MLDPAKTCKLVKCTEAPKTLTIVEQIDTEKILARVYLEIFCVFIDFTNAINSKYSH